MVQELIYQCLVDSTKPLSAREISEKEGLVVSKVCMALKQMIKYKEVFFIEIDRFEAMQRFKCKRRMRLYYIKEEK